MGAHGCRCVLQGAAGLGCFEVPSEDAFTDTPLEKVVHREAATVPMMSLIFEIVLYFP